MDQILFGEKFSHHEKDTDVDFEDAGKEAGTERDFNKFLPLRVTWNPLLVNTRSFESELWILWKNSVVPVQHDTRFRRRDLFLPCHFSPI